MDIRITKPIQGGIVEAIPSKSDAHRLLICAALADNETYIACSTSSEDIDATARCLEALGAVVRYQEGGFFVTPINRNADKKDRLSLDCGESGSTLRFMLPVCGALGVAVSFVMSGRLPARPLSPLYEEMTRSGCVLSKHGVSPLDCQGQLRSGTYNIPGDISSQYISGLLFALPLLSGESKIQVTGILESRPYVDMTLDSIRRFGITVYEENEQGNLVFRIPGNQVFRSPKTLRVEGDWSNAAFWLCAGALLPKDKKITCTGLNLNSRQGDRAVIEILERFGATIHIEADSVTVSPAPLSGIDINAENTPDLVPVLAAVASVSNGATTVYNAKRLRIKESDRLVSVTALLTSLGGAVTETPDGLNINGREILSGGVADSFGDHRIAMTAAIISAVCKGEVTINNAQVVNKSYPHFFKDFEALGGMIIK